MPAFFVSWRARPRTMYNGVYHPTDGEKAVKGAIAMDVIVRGKNVDVTDALRSHTSKKLGKLAKFVDRHTGTATAMLSVEKDRQIVEVTIPVEGGRLLRGEEATPDMYASIDLVVDKLEKQFEKFKARNHRRPHEIPDPVGTVEPLEQEVVRRKTFPVKPMSLDEALLQMELLGHSFFAFANSETEAINVLYRRKDGTFGLLEPQ